MAIKKNKAKKIKDLKQYEFSDLSIFIESSFKPGFIFIDWKNY